MPYELIVQADFGAAHHLREYKGKCERIHGHNWKLDIVLTAASLGREGMLMDFADAKKAIAQALEKYDHYDLNGVSPFDVINPTSENIARVLAEDIQSLLPPDVRVARVTAWESDRCGATFIVE